MTYIIAYVKIQKNEDILSIMSNLQPNCCLKIDSSQTLLIYYTHIFPSLNNDVDNVSYTFVENDTANNVNWYESADDDKNITLVHFFK